MTRHLALILLVCVSGCVRSDFNLATQRQEYNPETKEPLDEDGSWDPIGEWGLAGGRVYSTAIGAMTLEVYYRFTRAQEGTGF